MNNNLQTLSEIKKILENCNKIIIAGHVNPDGDAVGACFAFALCLAGIGKTPIILLDEYSQRYNLLKGSEYIYTDKLDDIQADAFVAIDTSSKERLSHASSVFDRINITINIDHHISNTLFAKYNFVFNLSSASEIILDVVKEFMPLTKEIAECLYTGILFDTGGFRHSSTTDKTHEKIAELIRTGIDFSDIYRKIISIHSISEAKILSIALNNFIVLEGFPIAYSFLSIDDMKKANASFSDLDGIVEYILNLQGVEVSFLVTEREKNISKASFRSKEIDVNKIAGTFDGGGHIKAAGATINEPIDIACTKILDVLKKEF